MACGSVDWTTLSFASHCPCILLALLFILQCKQNATTLHTPRSQFMCIFWFAMQHNIAFIHFLWTSHFKQGNKCCAEETQNKPQTKIQNTISTITHCMRLNEVLITDSDFSSKPMLEWKQLCNTEIWWSFSSCLLSAHVNML